MPYPDHVKNLAYKLDPDCWASYSGKTPEYKARMDFRRSAALKKAGTYFKRRARVVFSFAPRQFGKTQAQLDAAHAKLAETKVMLNCMTQERNDLRLKNDLLGHRIACERATLQTVTRAHRFLLNRFAQEAKVRTEVADALRENRNRDDAPATARVLADAAIAALEL